jgi:hypothetical protein
MSGVSQTAQLSDLPGIYEILGITWGHEQILNL